MNPTPESDYCTIPLTQGQVAIVDAADYEWLSQWKWRARRDRFGRFYAVRETRENGKRTDAYMHRKIVGIECHEVDHRDHDTLNNRRGNLRPVSTSQNQCNSKLRTDNTSGVKGVSFQTRMARFRASIKVGGKYISLGYYKRLEDAAEARRAAEKKYHGEYALNQ